MQQDNVKSNSHYGHRESQAGQGNGQGYAHGQGQAMQAHDVARASVTSSVNGLIQQSFQWLDVDGMDDDNEDPSHPLAPPNPAFRSDRASVTSNKSITPSRTRSPSAHSLASSPSHLSIDNSSGVTVLGGLSLGTTPRPSSGAAAAAAMQPSYSPLIPSSNTSPPRQSSLPSSSSSSPPGPSALSFSTTTDHPRNPAASASQPHTRERTQSSAGEGFFYPDAHAHTPSPPPFPPPQFALPPSPSLNNNQRLIHQSHTFQPHLYDTPRSPGLPPSPHADEAYSQAFQDHQQQQDYYSPPNYGHPPRSASQSGYIAPAPAAGVVLPFSSPSPYASIRPSSANTAVQYSPLPTGATPSYPARTASISPSHLSSASSATRAYSPPSRNASNTYLPAGAGAAAIGGAAFADQASPTSMAFLPHQLHQPQFSSYPSDTSLLYAKPPQMPYAHSNATESTIWGEGSHTNDSGDEKGYYGAIDGGMHMDPVNGNGAEKRSSWKSMTNVAPGKATGKKKKWWIIGGIAVLVIGAAVIGVVVYLTKRNSDDAVAQSSANDKSNGSGSTGGNTSDASNDNGNSKGTESGPKKEATTGGDGSRITMENGESFIYRNNFGGTWSSTPFDDSAKAQSYTPALNERWDYSSDKIYGVNIGGWLHLEPFIAPAMFEPFADSANPAIDEWSLSLALGDSLHDTLVEHYETFITEQDFAQIAGAGLNWVRIALPFWAIEVYPGEPFLEGVCWQYFLKAISWARKYGLRINLDLHTIPGSQNGWNHSGKFGSIGFLNGVMGMANGQRTMNYLRVLTEFINQPEYRNVVPMFGIINEAQANVIGDEVIRSYYLQVYDMMREITGVGEGNGPVISLHDGFSGNLSTWNGYLTGSDRIVMDSHPYLAFDEPNTDSWPVQMGKACNRWGPMFNLSMANVGFTYAGEFSLGINDCGQYLNGVDVGIRYDGTYTGPGYEGMNVTGSCDQFMDVSTWDDDFKSQVYDFALASMDTFQNWFFWTWKIGNSTVYNRVATPMWSYSLGLQEGYVPSDPRVYHGSCVAMAEKYGQPAPDSLQFDGSLEPWMTGGAGAGQIEPTQIASYSLWPPTSMANIPLTDSLEVAQLPTYTATAPPLTLTASPTPTTTGGVQTPVLNGPYYTPIAGCANYLDPWGAAAATPIGTC